MKKGLAIAGALLALIVYAMIHRWEVRSVAYERGVLLYRLDHWTGRVTLNGDNVQAYSELNSPWWPDTKADAEVIRRTKLLRDAKP